MSTAIMIDDNEDLLFEEAVKWMKVTSIPLTVRHQLAYHLDNPCSHSDWKSLAEKNGLENLQIRWIEYRIPYTTHKSCTLFLFKKHLDKMNLTVDHLIRSLSEIGNEACVSVLRRAFDDGSLHASMKNKEIHSSASSDDEAIVKLNYHGDAGLLDGQTKKVFITYSPDAAETACLTYRWLTRNGIVAYLDLYDHQQLCENKLQWYDTKYSEADHILVLISRRYSKVIERKGKDAVTQSACYINNRMRAEYWKNNCRNKRFIPVILPKAKSDHAPDWLQNMTIFYHWPEHYKHIMFRIKDHVDPKPVSVQHVPVVTLTV